VDPKEVSADMSKKLGWGVVGTGWIAGDQMAPAIGKSLDAEFVAVVSRDQARGQEFADTHGAARALTSYEDLLADGDVDVVYIGTPNALHADEVVAAAGAGKHILCDKPLATSVADAERALEAANAAGVKLGINFQTRHHTVMPEIRKRVADGEIGAPLIVQCELSPGRKALGGWRTDSELAGLGTTNNLAIHAYDLLRYLLDDEVVEVTALYDVGRREEQETVALALLRFAGGTLAYVNANQVVPDNQPDIAIYGVEGRILGRSVMQSLPVGEVSVLSGGEEITTETSSLDAFEGCVNAFSRAVIDDTEPNASGVDGLRSVEIVDAVGRSAREGRLIELSAVT
jgi:1,5-anhydro-D-fructose reductase (1,5-anhydro-D-mannitol-forming)